MLGGKAKVQWKVDWALRWFALRVDYELYGKDLIDSARLSGQILRLMGGDPPLGFAYEMFLDEEGRKSFQVYRPRRNCRPMAALRPDRGR